MKHILAIFIKQVLIPNQWAWIALLLVSHSVSPAEKLKLSPMKRIPRASHPANGVQTDTRHKPASGNLVKKSNGRMPFYIDFSAIPDSITQEDSNKKPPSISPIPDRIIKEVEAMDPDIGDIPDNITEEASDIAMPDIGDIPDNITEEASDIAMPDMGFGSDNTTKESTTVIAPHNDTPSEIQKPKSSPAKLLPMHRFINHELGSPKIQDTAQRLAQFIKNGNIKEFRRLLSHTLQNKSPLQVLVIFHMVTKEGNTLIHWMATTHSKEFSQELKYILEAFGAYNEQIEKSPRNSLREMRQEIALMELDLDSLWQTESTTHLDDFEPAKMLKKTNTLSYYKSMIGELLTLGNTRRFLSIIADKTQEEDFFDLLKNVKIAFPSDQDFIREADQLIRLLTPPLYIKNLQGLTPLQLAIKTSRKKEDGTVVVLSRAEKIIGIDTNTDSSSHNKRISLLRRFGIGTAIVVGATACAYVFY